MKQSANRDRNALAAGLDLLDTSELPAEQRRVVMVMLREQRDIGLTIIQLKRLLPDLEQLEHRLKELIGKSIIVQSEHNGVTRYMIRIQPRRPRGSSLLDKLFS